MINELQTQINIKDSLMKLFESIQFARVINVLEKEAYNQGGPGSIRPDLILELETQNNKRYQLIVKVKSTGQPRLARMAINILQTLIGNKPGAYGIFAAPFISNESRKTCKEANVGFIDLAGNCYFRFDHIFIWIEGRKNPYPAAWSLKALFSPKSSRVLRALLSDVNRYWSTVELAEEIDVSPGLVTKAKQYLTENELAETSQDRKSRKFRLNDPERLLLEWSTKYSYQENRLYGYYSLDDIKVFEQKLPTILSGTDIRYAFSLTSGASFVAPHLRYVRSFVYVESGRIDEAAELLKLKRVESGANVVLMEPFDEAVFYDLQEIRGVKVVSDIQLYLDLRSYKERGDEAAQSVFEQRIKNKW